MGNIHAGTSGSINVCSPTIVCKKNRITTDGAKILLVVVTIYFIFAVAFRPLFLGSGCFGSATSLPAESRMHLTVTASEGDILMGAVGVGAEAKELVIKQNRNVKINGNVAQ